MPSAAFVLAIDSFASTAPVKARMASMVSGMTIAWFVDHVGVKELIVLHTEHVSPQGDLVEVGMRSSAMGHHLLDRVERDESIADADQGNSGRRAKDIEDFVLARLARHLH